MSEKRYQDPDELLAESTARDIERIWNMGILGTWISVGNMVNERIFDGDWEAALAEDAPRPRAWALLKRKARKLTISGRGLKLALRVAGQYNQMPRSIADHLSATHHEMLLPVKDSQKKLALAQEAVERSLTAEQLDKKVRREYPRHAGGRTRNPDAYQRLAEVCRVFEREGFGQATSSQEMKKLTAEQKVALGKWLIQAREAIEKISDALARVK